MHAWRNVALAALITLFPVLGGRQEDPQGQAGSPPKGMMMLTIFLKHDQSKTLNQINQYLQQTGFAQKFPPPETEVAPGT